MSKIGRWREIKGNYATPGGTPLYECGSCGGSQHLHGVEYQRRKVICDNCGRINIYLEFIENRQPADVVPYSIEPDGTLTVTVPKGTKRIGRILIEEDGTQYGGLFYPDTGGFFLSSMERSEQDG